MKIKNLQKKPDATCIRIHDWYVYSDPLCISEFLISKKLNSLKVSI